MHRLRTLASFAILAALAACGDSGPSEPPIPRLSVAVDGRLERGETVTVAVTRDGAPVDPAAWTATFDPADAVVAVGPGRYRLARAGRVTVRASSSGVQGTADVQVASPPVIVFDLLRGGNRDIWSVALDGGDLTRLTEDPGDDQDPTVAQGRVVFVSYRAGNGELYAVSLGGGAATRLTNTPKAELGPSLRPDGQRLAFTYESGIVAKLHVADGTGQDRAAGAPGFGFDGSIDAGPSWAPSGNRLAFVSTAAGSADIYDLTVGGTPTVLVGSPGADVEPSFSPDGTRLAYVSTVNDDAEVFVRRLSDGQTTRVTTRAGTDAQPTWTADGRLVWTEFTGSQTRLRWVDLAAPADVRTIDVGTGVPQRPAGVRP